MERIRTTQSVSVSAGAALVAGAVITVTLVFSAHALERRNLSLSLERRADLRFAALETGIRNATDALRVLNQYFRVAWPVSREQFREFTRPILAEHPYIQAFSFHRVVSDTARADYLAATRREVPDFQIRELAENDGLVAGRPHPVSTIVDYVEPLEENRSALGLDVTQNVEEIAAMAHARRFDEIAATPPMPLVQPLPDDAGLGIVAVLPVFARDRLVSSGDDGYLGDTAVVFHMRELVRRVLDGQRLLSSPDLRVAVSAALPGNRSYLGFETSPRPNAGASNASWAPLDWRPPPTSRTLDVGGQTWTMEVELVHLDPWAVYSGSLGTLLFGSLLTLATSLYFALITRQADEISRLVDERTLELKATNKALLFRQRAIEASANAVLIIHDQTPEFTIDFANPAFERMTGYAIDEALGRSYAMLWGSEADQPGVRKLMAAIAEGSEAHASARLVKKNGSPFWAEIYLAPVKDETAASRHFVVIQYDVTDTKRYADALEFQATHDELTGIANRNLLHENLAQAMKHAQREGQRVWVVLLDLDRFKRINDTQGHHQGDLVIQALAQRLSALIGRQDTVARFGGDEFVIVLAAAGPADDPHKKVVALMQAVQDPVAVAGHEYFLTCSMGIAIFPDDATDFETLLAHADAAMYRAKEGGRNHFCFFSAELSEKSREKVRLERDLRQALGGNELALYYQGQVRLANAQCIGAEALIRWLHPSLGLLPPGRFLPTAEESGLISDVGTWTIGAAAAMLAQLRELGLTELTIAVNISARQFQSGQLVEEVRRAVMERDLDPTRLELELTEQTLIDDTERALEVLASLKRLGVRIALDDFGTGYSSLAYLRRFPLDVLKIDRTFVAEVSHEPSVQTIVTSIITLAHALGLTTVAEGVETVEQLAYLRRAGCDVAQGFLLSHPLPGDLLLGELAAGRSVAHLDALRALIAAAPSGPA